MAEVLVPIIVALIGFSGIAYQVRSVRRENTEQHDQGAERLRLAVEEAKQHTDARVAPVESKVDRVESKVDRIDGKVDTLVAYLDVPTR